MKLLRPLHRRRSRRRARARVLSSQELIDYFDISMQSHNADLVEPQSLPAEHVNKLVSENRSQEDKTIDKLDLMRLEQCLQQQGISYHKDSQGEIWASINDDDATGKPKT